MKKMTIVVMCLLGINTLINTMEKEQKDFYIRVFLVYKNLNERIICVQKALGQKQDKLYKEELNKIKEVFTQFSLGNFIAYNAYVAPLQFHLAQLEQNVLGQQTGFGPIDQKDKRYKTEIKPRLICTVQLPEDWKQELSKGSSMQLQSALVKKEVEKTPTNTQEEQKKVSFEGLPQLSLERSDSSDSVNSVQIHSDAENDSPSKGISQPQSQELSSDDSGQEEGSDEKYQFSNKDEMQIDEQDSKDQSTQSDTKNVTGKQDTSAPIKSDPVISQKSCCRRLLPFLAGGSIIAIVAGGAGYYFCIHKCEDSSENLDTQDLETQPDVTL
jgi:hypothetical protein